MKVALITDTHFGARNDNAIFAKHFNKFYENVFFPTLEEEGIKHVIHMGDLVDKRRQINYITKQSVNNFLYELSTRSIDAYFIAGNHDCYYKNTNKINALDSLVRDGGNNTFACFDTYATTINFGGTKIVLVPWVSPDEGDSILSEVKNTEAQILLGHLEINGFRMNGGYVCEHGFDRDVFKQFDMVLSGHFHDPSEGGNIKYLGAPYEMDWSDYNGKRGFHILDTQTRSLTFVENPYKIFHIIPYDDNAMSTDDVAEMDFGKYEDCFVKLLVQHKLNDATFNLFVEKLQECGPADLKIIEDLSVINGVSEDEIDEARDTQSILLEYVDGIDTKQNKNHIKQTVLELYNEAINL